ncbi:hypothetical protein Tco_1084647, partial [Tanacetum coccineum]
SMVATSRQFLLPPGMRAEKGHVGVCRNQKLTAVSESSKRSQKRYLLSQTAFASVLHKQVGKKLYFFSRESSILEKSENAGFNSVGVRVHESEFITKIARGSENEVNGDINGKMFVINMLKPSLMSGLSGSLFFDGEQRIRQSRSEENDECKKGVAATTSIYNKIEMKSAISGTLKGRPFN